MRLDVNLSALHQIVRRIGAGNAEVPDIVGRLAREFDRIDIELEAGKEVLLTEVDLTQGLLSFAGRQVLLYMPEHKRGRILKAIENPEYANKYHVSYCSHLEKMYNLRELKGYKATRDLSGSFEIFGRPSDGAERVAANVKLNVCKFCLRKLNYRGYRRNKKKVFLEFTLQAFFSAYSTVFKHLPKAFRVESGTYTEDWPLVSKSYRERKNFTCEDCGVNLSEVRNFLHTHHIDGVKTNNDFRNLRALCVDCHSKQAFHEHLFVSRKAMETISRLRNEQHVKGELDWQGAFKYASEAAYGVMYAAKAAGEPPPDVGHEIADERGMIVAMVELAWPVRKLAVATDEESLELARRAGWRALSLDDALTDEWPD